MWRLLVLTILKGTAYTGGNNIHSSCCKQKNQQKQIKRIFLIKLIKPILSPVIETDEYKDKMNSEMEVNEWFYLINECFTEKFTLARTMQWRIEDKIQQLPEECCREALQGALLISEAEQQHYKDIITTALRACDAVNTLIASHNRDARQEQYGDIWRTEERAVELKFAMSEFYKTQRIINNRAGFPVEQN